MIEHISLRCKDAKKSGDFYTKTLKRHSTPVERTTRKK
jgi:catechol 2,3-dioxygenase-like lactoylglutathione lyase family enzyme